MKAVVVGPGRVGCGFVGPLLRASGYSVVFVGRNRRTLACLNHAGRYRLRLLQGRHAEETLIDGVHAISTDARREVIEALAGADLIATAVGSVNLPAIAALVADGLRQRRKPACVLAFENLPDAGSRLRELVSRRWRGAASFRHGFASALVSRVISRMVVEPNEDAPLTFIGDPPATFVVDGCGLPNEPPPIVGMTVTLDYTAHLRRKLFIYSAGHAVCAYLGHLKGYRYVHSAIRDSEIRRMVLNAMAEGQRGLAATYGPDLTGGPLEPQRNLERFDNAALDDPIVRVARDPLRKLAAEDRLVGAATLAWRAGATPTNLAVAAAAALLYSNPADVESVALRRELETIGIRRALERFSGVDPRSTFGGLVIAAYRRLAEDWQAENQLLSLENVVWAWRLPRLPVRSL